MMPLSNVPTKNRQYKCNRCDTGFTTPGNLKRHILNIHLQDETLSLDKQLKSCKYCNKNYSRQDYLTQHIRTLHERKVKHCCEHCGKTFTQKGSLTRHVSSVHMKVKEYCCKHCEYQAVSYNDLKKHAAKRHFNRSRFECFTCGFSHWSASVVKKHVDSSHVVSNKVNNRKCRYCGLIVNLSNESFTLHAAACKTMLSSEKSAISKKKLLKRIPETEKNDGIVEPVTSDLDTAVSIEDIPWYELLKVEDEDIPFPQHAIESTAISDAFL